MFIIDRSDNRITRLKQKSFSKLGFREREHLQEWVANNTESLGEELLVIQKEFNGFNDTNERLEETLFTERCCLAINKKGSISAPFL